MTAASDNTCALFQRGEPQLAETKKDLSNAILCLPTQMQVPLCSMELMPWKVCIGLQPMAGSLVQPFSKKASY